MQNSSITFRLHNLQLPFSSTWKYGILALAILLLLGALTILAYQICQLQKHSRTGKSKYCAVVFLLPSTYVTVTGTPWQAACRGTLGQLGEWLLLGRWCEPGAAPPVLVLPVRGTWALSRSYRKAVPFLVATLCQLGIAYCFSLFRQRGNTAVKTG